MVAIRIALVYSILFIDIISHAYPQQVFNICCSENISQLWSSQHSNCQSLDSVLSELLPNNSVLELTNGSCNLTQSLNFTRVSNITIRGQGSQYTHISCHHMNAGLVFNESSNIELRDFTIDSCGVQIDHKELTNVTGNASKSIVFTNTTNVVLQWLVIATSNGYGLMISDCFGSVLLNNIIFENNKVIDSELEYTYGGGGLLIVFIPYQQHQNTQYTISNCKFVDNSANIRKVNWGYSLIERGGGISLLFLHNSEDIYIKLENCYFKNNTGSHGGGLFSWYSDNSTNCHLAVYNTEFYGNHATSSSPSYGDKKAGGGVQLRFSISLRQKKLIPMNNSMLFDSVNFTANTAYNGGGASLFISSISTMKFNNITFKSCFFINNSGNGGSALEITPSYTEQQQSQFISQILLIDCIFTDNVPNPQNEIGQESTLFTTQIPVILRGSTKFSNNGASAIYASSALLIFQENTSIEFYNNVGSKGGAIFLVGDSRMLVYDNTAFQFTNNSASYGGAICSLPSDNSITYGDSCFLIPQEKEYKNISLHFAGNKASRKFGNDIFVSSLASCCKYCQIGSAQMIAPENIFSSQCIGKYTFETPGNSIATSPSLLNTSSSNLELTPGLPHELDITQTDELGNDIVDMYLVTAEITDVTESLTTVHNNSITLCGKPGTIGTIVLENNAPVVRRKHIDFFLSHCPPGFSLDSNNACTCSASTAHSYFQMPFCHKKSALITHGFWVGYIGNSSEDTLFTGTCTFWFCTYKGKPGVNGYNEIPTSIKTKKELEAIVCSENRKGILCGSCIEGHSTFYHSPAYTCYNTTTAHCAYGIPLYIVSELLPVTIIFIIILVFNISLTSGALYSFVLYAQLLDFLYIDSFEALSSSETSLTKVVKIVHMVYSTFNLKTLYGEFFSFCLISNGNAMDVFMFQYGTILYAVMLVIATVLVLRLHSCYCCVKLGNRCGRRNIRGSIVDGLSAFLMLCYFQCSVITFYILTPITLRGTGGIKNRTVPFFLGDLEYFGSGHLPYAIPAVLCLVVVMLPPPCILLLEPIATKLFSLHIWPESVKQVYNKLRFKFMPFLDSFQASFKDKYRFFAGLYFAYRVLIPLVYLSFRETHLTSYISVEILIFFIVFLHVLFRPYKVLWHNLLESAIFVILLFINTITIFNYTTALWRYHDILKEIKDLVWLQVLTIFFPLIYLAGYTIVSAYRNIKLCMKGYQRVATTPDASYTDSMGFPARLMDM